MISFHKNVLKKFNIDNKKCVLHIKHIRVISEGMMLKIQLCHHRKIENSYFHKIYVFTGFLIK